MWYRIGADLVLLLHLAFVLFVVTGGLLLLKWPRLAWLHLPAAIWGASRTGCGALVALMNVTIYWLVFGKPPRRRQ